MADWRARGYVADSDDDDDSQDLESSELSHLTSYQTCLLQYNTPDGSQPQSSDPSANASTVEKDIAQGNNADILRQSLAPSGTSGGKKSNRMNNANTRVEPNEQPFGVATRCSTPSTLASVSDGGGIDELQQENYRASPPSNSRLKSHQVTLGVLRQHNSSPLVPRNPSIEATSPSSTPQARSSPSIKPGWELHKTSPRSVSRGLHNNQILEVPVHAKHNFNVIVEVPTVPNHQENLRAGRNLRHRNPIQLHPYAIESEKYRQILKARGVKPLRIVQTQDGREGGHGEDSQMLEQDTQEEAQDFELSQELRRSRSRSSSPLPEVSNPYRFPTSRFIDRSENEGDEFPDVDTLLRAHQEGVSMKGFKRQKTAHAVPKKMRIETSIGGKVPDLFDTPVSPPLSSDSRRFKARPKLPKFKVPPVLSPITPPTPVTSSEPRKPFPNDISEDENSPTRNNFSVEEGQSEEPQLSDDSLAELQPPSPIQQAQRQIRGVLPASWLSLDRKIQKEKRNTKTVFQRVLSGGWGGPLRGVARRKEPHKSASLSKDRPHPIVLSDDQDSDTRSDRSEIASRTNVATATTTPDPWELNLGDHPVTLNFGEVEEDNRIDEMLPTRRRRSKGTRQRRTKGNVESKIRAAGHHQLHSKSTSSHDKGHQPRIIHHFKEGRKKQSALRPPRLSILDAFSPATGSPALVPKFLKVALRTARSRKDKSRQSPTRKFLKLATTKDTEDIDKTLSDWRSGRIRPSTIIGSKEARKPLTELTGSNEILSSSIHNAQKVAPATAPSKKNRRPPVAVKPRKLQQTLDQLVVQNTISQVREPNVRKYKFVPSHKNSKTIEHSGHVESSIGHSGPIRPATLEGLQSDQECQRTRFQHGLSRISEPSNARPKQQRRSLQRKRAPRHLTPGDNESFPDTAAFTGLAGHHDQELSVKPGIRRFSSGYPDRVEDDQFYPVRVTAGPDATGVITGFDRINPDSTTFDIQPLPSGTSLDSATFVGCGDFQRYTKVENFMEMDQSRGAQMFWLGNRTINLGMWNEAVASHFNIIFENIHQDISDPFSATPSTFRDEVSLMHGIVRYFSDHLSFADPIDRNAFLRESSASLEQLSARLINPKSHNAPVGESHILLGTFAIVQAYQLCRIAKHELVSSSLKAEVSRLLASTVKRTVHIVIRDHLLAFRSCLSRLGLEAFHEKPKLVINEDCIAIQAIVVSHHVLTQPDGSLAAFWEVFNECVPDQERLSHITAPYMERIWQYLLCFLPFLDLDDQGKVERNTKSDESRENWGPIRRLLDTVLDSYKADPESQHPSLNAYCRKTYARCFYLIKDWGWGKCDAIVGHLFDFFAQNQLAHLNHEEFWGNHGSPTFLDQLGKGQSLVLSSGDRCFHILIKIIGEVLVRLREDGDMRKAQNLVFRVMPNHGRYLPKEKSIRQADLDALRNHHDLLCTLYWASPPQHRPRLRAFRDLVDMHSSHRQACQLNIRAWSRLVRYQLSTQESLENLKPFADWFNDMLVCALNQHELAHSEGEAEASRRGLTSNNNISSSDICQDFRGLESAIYHNEIQVEMILLDALGALESAVQGAQNNEAASILINESLTKVFRRLDLSRRQANTVILEALDVVLAYTRRSKAATVQRTSKQANDDSQEYGDWSAFEEEESLSDQVLMLLHTPLRVLLSNCFGADIIPKDDLLMKIVDAYTSLASVLVRQGHSSWDEFISPFGQNSWHMLRDTLQKQRYHAYYMATLLELDSDILVNFKDHVMKSWFMSIVEREASLKFQNYFTSAVLNAASGDLLLRNPPFCTEKISERFRISGSEFSHGRKALVLTVLENMWEAVNDAALESLRKATEYKQQYKEWLQAMMQAMKRNYQDLGQGPYAGGAYVEFVQAIVQALHRNTSAICPVDKFFTDSSEFPLPAADPTYVVGQLQNYGLRLRDPRTPKRLAAFMQSLSERAVIDDQQADLTSKLHMAMSDTFENGDSASPTLRALFIKAVLPAYLTVGFVTEGGWIFLLPLLKALQLVFRELCTDLSANKRGSIESVASLLSSFLGDLWLSFRKLSGMASIMESCHILRLMSECYRTVTSLLPVLDYIRRLHAKTGSSVEMLGYFRSFATCTSESDVQYHKSAEVGPIEATMEPEFHSVRSFAQKELEVSLERFCYRHNTRMEAITSRLGIDEEERKAYHDSVQSFLDCLQDLPTSKTEERWGGWARASMTLRLDEIMI